MLAREIVPRGGKEWSADVRRAPRRRLRVSQPWAAHSAIPRGQISCCGCKKPSWGRHLPVTPVGQDLANRDPRSGVCPCSNAPFIAFLVTRPFPSDAQDQVPATLAGHAVLPAFSFSSPPQDAPAKTWISGRFTAGMIPVNTPQSLEAERHDAPLFRSADPGVFGLCLRPRRRRRDLCADRQRLRVEGQFLRRAVELSRGWSRISRPARSRCRSASGFAIPTGSCPSVSFTRRPRRAT
jgi:hypothetical protein